MYAVYLFYYRVKNKLKNLKIKIWYVVAFESLKTPERPYTSNFVLIQK